MSGKSRHNLEALTSLNLEVLPERPALIVQQQLEGDRTPSVLGTPDPPARLQTSEGLPLLPRQAIALAARTVDGIS